MFKLDLERTEEPEIKLQTSAGSSKKQEFQKYIYFCFIDYAKAFDYVDHDETVENSGSRWWDGSPQAVGFEMWFTFPLNTSTLLSTLLLFSRAHIQDCGQCRQRTTVAR